MATEQIFMITSGLSNKDMDCESSNKSLKSKRAYQQVDLWKRKELIDCVRSKQETMKDSAKRLGINYCTAKHILKVYRRSGSYETDLMRKKKKQHEELRQKVLNDSQFADLTMKELDTCSQGAQGSTKEVPAIEEISNHESTHHNTTENTFDAQPVEASIPTCSGLNPNFLFENVSSDFSADFRPQLKGVWMFLGDLVYDKFSPQ